MSDTTLTRVDTLGRVEVVGRNMSDAKYVSPWLQALYYLGRFAQLIGMWILLVDIVTAGQLGPDPKIFAAGVVAFLAGWGLTLARKR